MNLIATKPWGRAKTYALGVLACLLYDHLHRRRINAIVRINSKKDNSIAARLLGGSSTKSNIPVSATTYNGCVHGDATVAELIETATNKWAGTEADEHGVHRVSRLHSAEYLDLQVFGVEIPFSLARILLLTSSVVLICVVLFTPHTDYLGKATKEPWSKLQNAFFISFGHTAFVLSVAVLVLICLLGQGAILSAFLSLRVFHPLSKLSYSAFMIHVIIIFAVYASSGALHYYSDIYFFYLFVTNVFLAYVFGVALYAIFERPYRALTRVVVERLYQMNKWGRVV